MKIIAVINQKGGVGKTTTSANLGAGLARLGKRVLLLDLDPQANLTLHLDRRPELEARTMTHVLIEDETIAGLVEPTTTPGLFIVPSDTSLGGVEQVLANRIGREMLLREALQKCAQTESFDYVVMDCPPSLGVLSANALVSAHEVLVPMQTEYFSLQGMAKLHEVIELVQRRLNPELKILAVLPCMVDLRTRLTEEVLREIGTHFGQLLAESHIRNNVKLAEAPSFGLSIFEHAPESNGAKDYWALAVEVLERHGENISAELRDPASLLRSATGEPPEDVATSPPTSPEAAVPEAPPRSAPAEAPWPTPPAPARWGETESGQAAEFDGT